MVNQDLKILIEIKTPSETELEALDYTESFLSSVDLELLEKGLRERGIQYMKEAEISVHIQREGSSDDVYSDNNSILLKAKSDTSVH